MQNLIIGTLKFVAYALVILACLAGALIGAHQGGIGGFVLGGVLGFVIAVVASGVVLLLIDIADHLRIIAANPRR
jgi:hypothetical protein